MDYTVFTGDTTHKAAILTALSKNIGENNDFAPAAQSGWEANDDQAYWLYSALTALEYNFDPISPTSPSWLTIATNTFELFAKRWAADSATCGGGLKWQYDPNAKGYYYKNSVSNGGFFQAAARLALYTGNVTYADWADRIWDWTSAVGLINPDFKEYHTSVGFTSSGFDVYDGAGDEGEANCTGIDTKQWSYNVATYMHGAAAMFNYTEGNSKWRIRVEALLSTAESTFFSPPPGNATGVMYEQQCELTSSCTIDQTSFKSSLARWMGKTAALMPRLADDIMELLTSSAKAAAASCTNGPAGNVVCGMKWWTADGFDGYSDFGSMLSALEVVQSLLVGNAPRLAKLTPS